MSATLTPEKAADELYHAMKGLGTNEKKIIHAIAGQDNEAIKKIKEIFQAKYHKDLIKEIKSETSGHFEDLLVGLLTDPVEYDAHLIYDAMKGLGTKDSQLMEVLISRHPDHFKKVREAFNRNHGRSLDEWIASETSGDYRKYLLMLAEANRASSAGPVDKERADEDARRLYRAGQGTLGTDEEYFLEIFSRRSYKHMRVVADKYNEQHSNSLATAIKEEFSGDIEKALLWSLEFFENRQAFFARRLFDAMKGVGTRDDDLVRIMVSRRTVDLYEIADEFNKIYGKSLKEMLVSEASGDYRDLLVEMLREA